MCTQFTTLAESNDFRHILQCEHGTLHLSWDLVTLYLSASEFEHLLNLLERGTRLVEPAKISEPPCILSYKAQGYFQLWIRNFALNLTPIDFLILVDLVRVAWRAACEQPALEQPSVSAGDQPPMFQRTVAASAQVSFSLN
ncbi:MAG: hypothetical protein L6R45_29195 [Anaerolineae bacterium]|nr:hypothetical protein [Anaerolineae bacterium]